MKTALASALVMIFVCLSIGCGSSAPAPVATADTIYYGGDIVTVNDSQPSAEAIAIKDGKILALGTRAEIEKSNKGANTHLVDLAGKTLLPGFLDPHSHYINSLSVANQVNVYAPPAGPGKDIPSIVAELKKFRDANKTPAGVVIQGYGYDENVMPNGVGLSRTDLDPAFPDNPVLVNHVSMHGAVLNSAAFKKYGFSAATKTPAGGIILRQKGSNEPAGLIMETAYLPVFNALPHPTADEEAAWSRSGQMLYAAAGITTAQEGLTPAGDLALIQRAAAQGVQTIDIIAYPFILDLDKVLETNPAASFGKYVNHVKLGGVKITMDGSPQGKTAFFTTPYLTGGPGGEKNWRGEPSFPEETVKGCSKKSTTSACR